MSATEVGAVSPVLSRRSVDDLIDGRVLAIHVRGFLDAATCGRLSGWLHDHPDAVTYTVRFAGPDGAMVEMSAGVRRVGPPLNQAVARDGGSFRWDPATLERYGQESARYVDQLREVCAPGPTPGERLAAALAAVWPGPVNGLRAGEAATYSGIGRITEPRARLLEASPHVDALPTEFGVPTQLGANLYLSVPDDGGEAGGLQVWPGPPVTPEDVYLRGVTSFDRAALAEPTTVVPAAGDLVILSTHRPHAVLQFERGRRVSMHSFVSRLADGGLAVWS